MRKIYTDELYHYGIKGMKWGVRRFQNKSGKLTSLGKKRVKSQDHLRAKELKKKKLSEMSNAELKELNNRMQLESQYKNLKRQNVNAGEKFVKDVAYDAGKSVASEYARKYAKKGATYIGKAITGR